MNSSLGDNAQARPGSYSERPVLGVDLAGVPHRPSGVCVLRPRLHCELRLVWQDRALHELARVLRPEVIAVDAPLALPKGRTSLSRRQDIHLRACDRELLRRGIRFFPVTLGPMRELTRRGIRLRRRWEALGFDVIEVYPGAAQDLLGLPRKQRGVPRLRHALLRYGFTGDVRRRDVTHHELDAAVCALVGQLFLEGRYEAIGDPQEVQMILPAVDRRT